MKLYYTLLKNSALRIFTPATFVDNKFFYKNVIFFFYNECYKKKWLLVFFCNLILSNVIVPCEIGTKANVLIVVFL